MNTTPGRSYPAVTVDGTGVASHAGTVLLGEVADRMGLTARFGDVMGGARQRRAGHEPGWVLVDVAVAVADGAVAGVRRRGAGRAEPTPGFEREEVACRLIVGRWSGRRRAGWF
ncbi:MAG: hypothetical protein M3P18_08350 [Actinomycetota bacterium]|nr:hypothetical protein [Actinomycetota bacterium]